MILHTTTTSERGKAVEKTGNEYIQMELSRSRVITHQLHFQNNYIILLDCRSGEVLYEKGTDERPANYNHKNGCICPDCSSIS